MKSRPLGISYFDGTNSVLIAELTNSIGWILPSGNQVIWSNCFSGVDCDLQATCRKSGFECDLVLRKRPPDPGQFGLNPKTTRLQLLTEFYDTPQPQQTVSPAGADGLRDTTLQFGGMRMIRGKSFSIALESTNGPSPRKSVPVYKTWTQFPDAQNPAILRSILIEEVPYERVSRQLQMLTASAETTPAAAKKDAVLCRVSPSRLLPPRRPIQSNPAPMQFATAAGSPTPGVVLDYVTINMDQSDYIFRGDTTYFVSSGFEITGTATFEGGTVIKFPTGTWGTAIICSGPIKCPSDQYRPVIFTAMDDDTVGQMINNSRHTPSGYYGEYLHPVNYSGETVLKNVRFSYAWIGLDLESSLQLWDAQFVDCYDPFYCMDDASLTINNALFYSSDHLFEGDWLAISGSQWTVHACGQIGVCYQSALTLNNSLLVSVPGGWGQGVSPTTDHVPDFIQDDSGVFQSFGGGKHYLSSYSNYRDLGTTHIETAVLADIESKTTSAPGDTFSENNPPYSPLAPPYPLNDTGLPDLGYHYPILDFLLQNVSLTFPLVLENGVAVGIEGSYGLNAQDGGGVTSTPFWPVQMQRIVSCQNVQELAPAGGNNFILFNSGTDASRQFQFQSTDFSVGQGGRGNILESGSGMPPFQTISIQNCWLRGAFLGGNLVPSGSETVDLENNLCVRSQVAFAFYSWSDPGNYAVGFNCYNCLFEGGSLDVTCQAGTAPLPNWNVKDNLFDGASQTLYTDAPGNALLMRSKNGFTYGTTDSLQGQYDRQGLTADFQPGPMGSYYYPSSGNGDLFALVNAGSRQASDAGLDTFTTQTDQTPDSGLVDIGYHYSVVSAPAAYDDPFQQVCPNGSNDINLGASDPEGLPLTYSIVTWPAHGSLTQGQNNGEFIYQPDSCYEGLDYVTFKANNGYLDSNVATVTLTTGDSISVGYSPSPVQTAVNTATGPITLYVSDSCGDASLPSSFQITRQPDNGSLSPLSGNPPYTIYTPNHNFSGVDSFEFQVTSQCGDSRGAIVFITVGSGGPFTEVTRLNGGPVGIDYSPTENALLVSVDGGDPDFGGDDLVRVGLDGLNNLTVGGWSSLGGLQDEVKLATVKTTANGFNAGELFFSNNGAVNWVGRVSADGQTTTPNFAELVNDTYIRGSLYVDQTSVFNNDLIAVTGNGTEGGGVWKVDATNNATLITHVDVDPSDHHLEGVITLANDPAKWGPWAGKIITGNEDNDLLYAIDPNRNVSSYSLGIGSEDFDIIPPNQDLYICDFDNNRILKVSRSLLQGYVGDLLITQAGDGQANPQDPRLFIVSWNGSQFVIRSIAGSAYGLLHFEHVTFAPIDLPSQALQ